MHLFLQTLNGVESMKEIPVCFLVQQALVSSHLEKSCYLVRKVRFKMGMHIVGVKAF